MRRSWWSRLLRWLIALVLVPVAVGASWALWDFVLRVAQYPAKWIPLACGMAVWWVVFISLPKPMWLYVVGHELTHALWAWMFGGRVKSFKASARGGQVILTKSNSFIVLAPYFFPLYSALWTVGWVACAGFLGWRDPELWMLLGLGVSYAFHLTLTGHVIRTRQPDFDGEGWIFSAVLVWLLHVLLLLLTLPWLTRVHSPGFALSNAIEHTGTLLKNGVQMLR